MLLNCSTRRLVATLSIIIGVLFVFQTPLLAAQESGYHVEDVANIDFRVDVRIFAVMAALNVAGFDYEAAGEDMARVRRKVRQELQSVDPELIRILEQYYSTHNYSDAVAAHTAYTSLALVVGPPPHFEIKEDGPRLPADVTEILDFNQLLAQFYERANIGELWQEHSAAYARELQRYRPVVREVIRDTLDYFGIPARIVLDRKLVLIPDLLGYQNVVHARNLEKIYYIVLGPAEDPASNYVQLQHEYLHFLVDPLVEKHAGIILTTQNLLSLAQQQPGLSADFQNQYLLIVGESLIEAILWRLHPPENPDEKVVTLFRKGLIFVPYFVSALETLEKIADRSLPVHLEDIFAGISESDIEKEAERILAAVEAEKKEQQKERNLLLQKKAEYEEREEKRRLLNFVAGLIRQQDYEEARTELSKLLELDADNPHALFYLGQIAAQEGLHDEAFDFYRKVSVSSRVEPWIQATAIVRMGRYLAYQRQFAEARKLFEKVLALSGDLKGAREAAESALMQLENR